MSSAAKDEEWAMSAVAGHAGEAAALLKALANDQRLQVLCCLLEGPLSVGAINERVALSQSALSQHLAVLRAAGVVTTRREAQTVHYALTDGPVLGIMRVLYSTFCARPAAPSGARPRKARAARGAGPRRAGG